ncbi:OLC1v1023560C1 [Oldenlandia corymbosa var. corymbosa]|uniref:Xyloglucan endotransglucosylase/hydrolase n=1 Tax=Oldenlandia corymbosa var. corymbosa TaxID=529605 RepID=A0AAV1C079_OLDCO|nr:OLC1v1023560C1 [Oldenlandia corymbosa var. corymbosa]
MASYVILLLSVIIFSFSVLLLSLSLSSLVFVSFTTVGTFHQHISINWGEERAQILEKGQLVTLTLDQFSGSGFQSKDEYLYGRVDMQLKLVPGDSAGTVTAFYLSSDEPAHDEIDFEFLGNVSGEPYIVHTNIYTQGHAGREMQFYMWFDPTEDFHTYTIIWNPKRIIFLVDEIPIRVFNNHEDLGVPFPSRQPMRLYSSIWNAESWATQGGKVRIDWSKAPFTASARNLKIDASVWHSDDASSPNKTWMNQQLDAIGKRNLQWVHKNYMVYNYCRDYKYIYGIPLECTL